MEQKQPEKRKRGKRYALVGGVLVVVLVGYLLGVATGKRGGDVRPGVRVTAVAATAKRRPGGDGDGGGVGL